MSKQVGNYSISLSSRLGKGAFAEVYEARRIDTHEEYAIKQIDRSKLLNHKVQEGLESEIEIMRGCTHENIVCLYDHFTTARHVYLVLELCKGGDLHNFINRYKRLEEPVVRRFLLQLESGLVFLAERNFLHRDIKPQNILLSEFSTRAILKLADFGMARALAGAALAHTHCGSPLYMAPEILSNKEYNAKADLWSVGCVVFEMLTGATPYTGTSPMSLLNNILREKLVFPNSISVSNELRSIIILLLNPDPDRRGSLAEFTNLCDVIRSPTDNTTNSDIFPMKSDNQKSVETATNASLESPIINRKSNNTGSSTRSVTDQVTHRPFASPPISSDKTVGQLEGIISDDNLVIDKRNNTSRRNSDPVPRKVIPEGGAEEDCPNPCSSPSLPPEQNGNNNGSTGRPSGARAGHSSPTSTSGPNSGLASPSIGTSNSTGGAMSSTSISSRNVVGGLRPTAVTPATATLVLGLGQHHKPPLPSGGGSIAGIASASSPSLLSTSPKQPSSMPALPLPSMPSSPSNQTSIRGSPTSGRPAPSTASTSTKGKPSDGIVFTFGLPQPLILPSPVNVVSNSSASTMANSNINHVNSTSNSQRPIAHHPDVSESALSDDDFVLVEDTSHPWKAVNSDSSEPRSSQSAQPQAGDLSVSTLSAMETRAVYVAALAQHCQRIAAIVSSITLAADTHVRDEMNLTSIDSARDRRRAVKAFSGTGLPPPSIACALALYVRGLTLLRDVLQKSLGLRLTELDGSVHIEPTDRLIEELAVRYHVLLQRAENCKKLLQQQQPPTVETVLPPEPLLIQAALLHTREGGMSQLLGQLPQAYVSLGHAKMLLEASLLTTQDPKDRKSLQLLIKSVMDKLEVCERSGAALGYGYGASGRFGSNNAGGPDMTTSRTGSRSRSQSFGLT